MPEKLIRGRYVIADPAKLPHAGMIENGAVAVSGGTIAAVGDYGELRARFSEAEEFGSDRHIVMPGLINTHHHGWGVTSFQLGSHDDYLEQWIPVIWGLKPLDRYLETLRSDLQNIRSGVTTHLHAAYFRDWAYRGNFEQETRAALRAHADSGIRTAYATQVLNRNTFVYQDDREFLARLPPALAETLSSFIPPSGAHAVPGDFFDILERLVAEFADHPRINVMIAPVNPIWCTDDLLVRVRKAADSFGCGIHIHCNETPFQREHTRRVFGHSSVRHLCELGILGRDVSLGHAVWLDEQDMDICAATGTSVCHNPASNLRLRSGILPLARMLEKGVNVSIGMDGNSFGDDEDMLEEMRLAHKLSMLPRGLEPTAAPSSFDVLRMATVNGARSTTLGTSIGALRVGAKADVVVLDGEAFTRPYLAPSLHIVDAILYRARGSHVETVFIDGELVLHRGRFTRVDANAVEAALRELAQRPPSPEVARWQQAMADLKPHVSQFYAGWSTPPFKPCYTVNCMDAEHRS